MKEEGRGKWPGKVQASPSPTPSLPIVALTESARMGGKQRPHPPNVQPARGLEIARMTFVRAAQTHPGTAWDMPPPTTLTPPKIFIRAWSREHGQEALVGALSKVLNAPLKSRAEAVRGSTAHSSARGDRAVTATSSRPRARRERGLQITSCLEGTFSGTPAASIFHKK